MSDRWIGLQATLSISSMRPYTLAAVELSFFPQKKLNLDEFQFVLFQIFLTPLATFASQLRMRSDESSLLLTLVRSISVLSYDAMESMKE